MEKTWGACQPRASTKSFRVSLIWELPVVLEPSTEVQWFLGTIWPGLPEVFCLGSICFPREDLAPRDFLFRSTIQLVNSPHCVSSLPCRMHASTVYLLDLKTLTLSLSLCASTSVPLGFFKKRYFWTFYFICTS